MTLAQFLQIILASVSCTDIPTSFPIYHSHYSHHLPSYCRARSRPRNSSSSHNHGPARIPLVCPYVNNRRAQVSFLPATPRQVLKRSNPSLSHSCPTFFLTSFHPGRPFFLPLFSALLPASRSPPATLSRSEQRPIAILARSITLSFLPSTNHNDRPHAPRPRQSLPGRQGPCCRRKSRRRRRTAQARRLTARRHAR